MYPVGRADVDLGAGGVGGEGLEPPWLVPSTSHELRYDAVAGRRATWDWTIPLTTCISPLSWAACMGGIPTHSVRAPAAAAVSRMLPTRAPYSASQAGVP